MGKVWVLRKFSKLSTNTCKFQFEEERQSVEYDVKMMIMMLTEVLVWKGLSSIVLDECCLKMEKNGRLLFYISFSLIPLCNRLATNVRKPSNYFSELFFALLTSNLNACEMNHDKKVKALEVDTFGKSLKQRKKIEKS